MVTSNVDMTEVGHWAEEGSIAFQPRGHGKGIMSCLRPKTLCGTSGHIGGPRACIWATLIQDVLVKPSHNPFDIAALCLGISTGDFVNQPCLYFHYSMVQQHEDTLACVAMSHMDCSPVVAKLLSELNV